MQGNCGGTEVVVEVTVKVVVGVTGTYGDSGLADWLRFGLTSNASPSLVTDAYGRQANDALDSTIGFTPVNNVSADGGPAMSGCYVGRNPYDNFSAPYGFSSCSAEFDATVFDASGLIPPSATPVSVRLTQTAGFDDQLFSGRNVVDRGEAYC